MRANAQSAGRFLGYVHVQVASRVYALPVEARRLRLDDGSTMKSGFFAHGAGSFGILVDSEATEAVVKETVERASAEAATHIARSTLN